MHYEMKDSRVGQAFTARSLLWPNGSCDAKDLEQEAQQTTIIHSAEP